MLLQYNTTVIFSGGKVNKETGEIKYDGNNIYGLNKGVNTHMAKNIEWGAVALLSHSQFGKTGNEDFDGKEKEVYSNNAYMNTNNAYTGRSEGIAPSLSEGKSCSGTYSYNDYKCKCNDKNKCTEPKEKGKGTGASTTGTIYGVYDMSGGRSEMTMSKNERKVYSDTEMYFFPKEKKYYDLYKDYNINSILLGDATWETKNWDSNHYEQFPNILPCRGWYMYGIWYTGMFMNIGSWAPSIARTTLIP